MPRIILTALAVMVLAGQVIEAAEKELMFYHACMNQYDNQDLDAERPHMTPATTTVTPTMGAPSGVSTIGAPSEVSTIELVCESYGRLVYYGWQKGEYLSLSVSSDRLLNQFFKEIVAHQTMDHPLSADLAVKLLITRQNFV